MNALLLLTLSLMPALQDQGLTETTFHRIYLHNGNFIDGDVVQETPAAVTLKLRYGDMTIPRDQISRVELVRMAQVPEVAKPTAPKKAAPSEPPAAAPAEKPAPSKPAGKPLPAPSNAAGKSVQDTLLELRKAPQDRIAVLLQKLVETGPEGAAYLVGVLSQVEDKLIPLVGDALARIKDRETLPALVEHLSNNKPAVRLYALRAIIAIAEPSAAPAIRPLLKDPDAEVRSVAVDALWTLDDLESFDDIGRLCYDADASVRGRAISAIVKMSERHDQKERLLRILEEALRESTGGGRGDIVKAIGRTRSKEMWSLVAPVLADESVEARAAAAIALRDLNAAESAPALMERIALERERQVRIQLAGTVQAMRLQQAIGPLVEWMSESDVDIKMAACRALRDITGQNYGTTYADWSAWWEGVKPK